MKGRVRGGAEGSVRVPSFPGDGDKCAGRLICPRTKNETGNFESMTDSITEKEMVTCKIPNRHS